MQIHPELLLVDESARKAQPKLNRLGRVTQRTVTNPAVSDSSASTSRRRSPRGFAILALALGVVTLSSCAVLEGPTPEAPKREAPAKPEVAPGLVSGGTAEENLPYFTEVLREFAAGEGTIKGEPVARAVIEAGFDKNLMQVSFDRSETGLEADNIFVSVLLGESCLIGQIVTSDRSFVAETGPAVGPENNLCLIGETAPITW